MPNRQLRANSSAPAQPRNIPALSRRDDCVDPDPANTVADRINTLLNSSGPGYVVSLCPNTEYIIQSPLFFAAANQEISTLGYPTDDSRATLVVNGPVANGTGHTCAVNGACGDCSGIALRNIQINGSRGNAPPTVGGANIEMGGANANQTIEFVRSYNPRDWSCLHVSEGPLTCTNALVQNNDIGPCGVDSFMEWADGISMSCKNSIVRNNMVEGPTDGGIVIFGSPGTQVYNNTIWITNNTLLGGINMVDYFPWLGNFTDTVVRNNTIIGGYATSPDTADDTMGSNTPGVFIEIGIALGPRTWFGDRYFANDSYGGIVVDNQLSGAFGYGIAMSRVSNFTVANNTLLGNTSFIGSAGPNCSTAVPLPAPAPFIYDNTTSGNTLQTDFEFVANAASLICLVPPNGTYWPFGSDPSLFVSSAASDSVVGSSSQTSSASSAMSTADVAMGVVVGIAALGVVAWFIRKWALKRIESQQLYNSSQEIVPWYGKHA
ncbi:hypothetical protein K438DRAFT_1908086 [Mycena galopus ATCC 62051]|nr:hypothetical protein K438DRAFT_1908086 [Mycena galopus ATCC 62051]